ncbi:unnamed protein product [Rotaria sp. Silwood2]|nr:unnamed protein product [Rotaria sp. Silwood2]
MNYRLIGSVLILLRINSIFTRTLYECDHYSVSCGCGRHNVELTSSRIVGGEEAIPLSWSMMVSIQHRSSHKHFCGGSILADSYILTAAHCVDGQTPDQILVVAGIHNKSDEDGLIRRVAQIFVHPHWSSYQNQHDIAILRLSQPLEFIYNRFLTRTCIPHVHWPNNIQDYPSTSTRLAAIGWGRTKMNDSVSSPDNLLQVEVFTIDNNDPICNKSLYDAEIQFCAALYEGGKDSCQGDSGGPILQWLGDRWEQVGLTSFSQGCAVAGDPSIYTRLSYYNHWIRSIVVDTDIRPPVTHTCDNEKVSCGCSYTDVEITPSRIVGGEEAVPYSWSFIVSIQHLSMNDHFCGGSIFSDFYIITAAHCVVDKSPYDIQIAAGIHNRSDPNGAIREVEQIHIHPNWSSSSSARLHDIALLRLSHPLDLRTNPLLTRVCVPNVQLPTLVETYPANGTRLTTIGWGNIRQSVFDNSPDNLHQVQVFTIDNNDPICNKSLFDKEVQFCAADYEGDKVSCGCGYKNVELTSSRIVGGEQAVVYSWSMVVSISVDDSPYYHCGGTIVNDSYILTAANCVNMLFPSVISVRAGVHNHLSTMGYKRRVDRIIIHPEWNASDHIHRNDIALLHIYPPLQLDIWKDVAQTCIPELNSSFNIVNYPPTGTDLVIVGWGIMQMTPMMLSNNLRQLRVFSMDNEDPICRQWIHDPRQQFCANSLNSSKGPRYGDEGGPVMEWKGNRWEQVGIISRTQLSEQSGLTIYTRLAHYSVWIESVINTSWISSTSRPPVVYRCDRTSICGCGQNDVALFPSRIVGGEDAVEGSWPMIASLRFPDESHRCGGTLLSESFILTAAHCFDELSMPSRMNITVAIGITDRSDPKQIIHKIDQIYIHPNYSNQNREHHHDIALLRVKTQVVYTNNPRLTKSCFHRINPLSSIIEHPKNGSRLAVIGWGVLTSETSFLPKMLQQVEVYTIDNNHPTCLNSIVDLQAQFCAGILKGGKDSCQGDSGGPILQWTGNYWEQVGIVSYGYGCADPDYPGIYTRLSYYYDWMNNILRSHGEHLEPWNQTTISSTLTTSTSRATTTGSFANKMMLSSVHETIIVTSLLNLFISFI